MLLHPKEWFTGRYWGLTSNCSTCKLQLHGAAYTEDHLPPPPPHYFSSFLLQESNWTVSGRNLLSAILTAGLPGT